jgi:hypothetical protein
MEKISRPTISRADTAIVVCKFFYSAVSIKIYSQDYNAEDNKE